MTRPALAGARMQFNVARLLQEPVGSTRSYAVENERVVLGDDLVAEQLNGTVKLLRIPKGILVEGDFTGQVRQNCARCLEEFTVAVPFHVEDEYRPIIDVVSGLPAEEPEAEEMVLRISPTHTLDLSEAVRQALLVELPMRPVCREECRGLCPQCGRNLNLEQCSCRPADGHPGLAALARLLGQEAGGEEI